MFAQAVGDPVELAGGNLESEKGPEQLAAAGVHIAYPGQCHEFLQVWGDEKAVGFGFKSVIVSNVYLSESGLGGVFFRGFSGVGPIDV